MTLDSGHMQPGLASCGEQIICGTAMQSPCVSPSPDIKRVLCKTLVRTICDER